MLFRFFLRFACSILSPFLQSSPGVFVLGIGSVRGSETSGSKQAARKQAARDLQQGGLRAIDFSPQVPLLKISNAAAVGQRPHEREHPVLDEREYLRAAGDVKMQTGSVMGRSGAPVFKKRTTSTHDGSRGEKILSIPQSSPPGADPRAYSTAESTGEDHAESSPRSSSSSSSSSGIIPSVRVPPALALLSPQHELWQIREHLLANNLKNVEPFSLRRIALSLAAKTALLKRFAPGTALRDLWSEAWLLANTGYWCGPGGGGAGPSCSWHGANHAVRSYFDDRGRGPLGALVERECPLPTVKELRPRQECECGEAVVDEVANCNAMADCSAGMLLGDVAGANVNVLERGGAGNTGGRGTAGGGNTVEDLPGGAEVVELAHDQVSLSRIKPMIPDVNVPKLLLCTVNLFLRTSDVREGFLQQNAWATGMAKIVK